jgi:hypothetical protein
MLRQFPTPPLIPACAADAASAFAARQSAASARRRRRGEGPRKRESTIRTGPRFAGDDWASFAFATCDSLGF